MRRRAVIAVLVAGCAHAAAAPTASRVDLPDAPPSPRARGGDELPAGSTARVSLDAGRDVVRALFDRYARAFTDRSVDAMRPLFAPRVDPVSLPRDGAARDEVLALHEMLFPSAQRVTALMSSMRVMSFAECRAVGCPAVRMAPGDWYVEWRPPVGRAVPSPMAPAVPYQLVVRVADGEARIVGITDSLVARASR